MGIVLTGLLLAVTAAAGLAAGGILFVSMLGNSEWDKTMSWMLGIAVVGGILAVAGWIMWERWGLFPGDGWGWVSAGLIGLVLVVLSIIVLNVVDAKKQARERESYSVD